MPRSYKNIQMYVEEILEMKSKRITLRVVGEQLGFTRKQDLCIFYNWALYNLEN